MAKKEDAAPKEAADVFAVFIDGLAENHTITADVAGIVKHAIEANRAKIEKQISGA